MALRPSGFVEYSPSEQLKFDQLAQVITQSYEAFGYTHIHTPAVESNAVLLSKNGEETGKQIFGLYGLAQGAEDLKEYSLHFDLTVPFARYVLDRESTLTFPFKRYQMQPVRRGERAQKGRFREFVQCDIDVIWKKEQGDEHLFYDAEIIFTLSQTLAAILAKMEIKDRALLHISNRKLIKGFLESLLPQTKREKVLPLIDKLKKIGREQFQASLEEEGISADIIQKITKFVQIQGTGQEISRLADAAQTPLYQEGYAELVQVVSYLDRWYAAYGLPPAYLIDMQMIRGLDYYTGTVFEAFLEQDESLGSICGGGRYAELTGYIDPKRDKYAGVGGSIGISRLLSKIFEQSVPSQNTVAEYLFLYFEKTLEEILALAASFQRAGKTVEIYPRSDKLGKQF